MNGIGYIYKITNKIDGMFYIGKTKYTIDARYKGHLNQALRNKELNITSSRLYNAMNKYGIDNFTVELVEECPYDILSERERYWISILDSRNPSVGYNICKGGECGPGGPMMKGKHHSLQTRQKMSADRMGSKNSNYGNRWSQSDELKALHSKLSKGENNGMYGKTHSQESKNKNRESHIGRKRMSNVNIYPKYKMIPQHNIKEYENQGWFLLK